MNGKTAIIIGAGPAGLTAAYELLKNTDITPLILEESEFIGGISRTAQHNGNRIDIGGHRFFSKIDKVNKLWQELMPWKATVSTLPSRMHPCSLLPCWQAPSTVSWIRRPYLSAI